MLNLNEDQIAAILDAVPFEMAFIDENDCIRYRNKIGHRMVPIGEELIGRDLRGCHQEATLPKVEKILSDLKSGAADEAWFWVSPEAPRILNRFIAFRDSAGQYLGTLEYMLNFDAIAAVAEGKEVAVTQEPVD